jgi:phytol kinase
VIAGPWQAAAALGAVTVLLGLMALVRARARSHGLSAELQRKLVHIGTGLFAMTLPWLFADRWPIFGLVALTLVVMAVLRLPRLARGGLGETLHGVERRSWGDVLLALAVLVVLVLSDGEPILYVLPLAILTLSDAAAALTGSRYGRTFFPVEDGVKTVEGSVTFFVVTLVVSMVCLLLLSDVSRTGVVLLSVVVAAFATQVEAESWRGFDNFFLPAGVALFLAEHMRDGPWHLAGIALGFAVLTWGLLRAAPLLGIGSHAARVYALAIFLLAIALAPWNLWLPLSVLAAHGLARRLAPSDAAHPELDIVAALALTGFGWLGLGLATGLNALSFWALTMAGLAAGLAALAARAAPGAWRWLPALAVTGALLAGWRVTEGANRIDWTGDLTGLAVGCLALAVAVPALRPDLFDTARAARLAALAAAGPLLGYAALALTMGRTA